MSINNLSNSAVYTTNTLAVAGTGASILGWLPPLLALVASAFSIVWFAIEIYESLTFKRFMAWLQKGKGE